MPQAIAAPAIKKAVETTPRTMSRIAKATGITKAAAARRLLAWAA
jgi:hypothetical protein